MFCTMFSKAVCEKLVMKVLLPGSLSPVPPEFQSSLGNLCTLPFPFVITTNGILFIGRKSELKQVLFYLFNKVFSIENLQLFLHFNISFYRKNKVNMPENVLNYCRKFWILNQLGIRNFLDFIVIYRHFAHNFTSKSRLVLNLVHTNIQELNQQSIFFYHKSVV